MPNIVPKGVIIHSMGEYIKTANGPVKASDFLKSIGLSVHGFLHPDGTYESMVKSPRKAYHAGVSEWGNLTNLNNHFLGIEVLVEGVHTWDTFVKKINVPYRQGPYTQLQYNILGEVVDWWMKKYNIPLSNIVRHSDVSGDEVRGKNKGKIDPGSGFDWGMFTSDLKYNY